MAAQPRWGRGVWAVGAAGLALRLYLAATTAGNYDYESFGIVADIMRRGGNVYAETSRYNYSPLWAHLLLAFQQVADWADLDFRFVGRAFISLVDLGNCVQVGMIAERTGRGRGALAFALYALNPVAIILSGFHGQFETLAVAPILLALQLCGRRVSFRWLWLCGTAALLIKHLTVFLVWMLFVHSVGLRRAVVGMVVALVVLAASFVPYLSAEGAEGILQNVVLYRSSQGSFGLTLFLVPATVGLVLFLAVLLWLPLWARGRVSTAVGMEASAVALIGLIPGFGVQYLLLPVLMGAVRHSPAYLVSGVIGGLLLMFCRDGLAPTADVNLALGLHAAGTAAAWIWLLTLLRDGSARVERRRWA